MVPTIPAAAPAAPRKLLRAPALDPAVPFLGLGILSQLGTFAGSMLLGLGSLAGALG